MNHVGQPPSGPEDTVAFQKDAIRRRFLESIAWIMIALALVALPISLARIPKTGLLSNHIVHICAGALAFFVFFRRKALADKWLIACYLATFTALTVSSFLQYGLVSAGFYFAATTVFIATMTIGLRAGLLCTAFFGALIAVMGYLWVSGYLSFPIDVREYVRLPLVWAVVGAGFLVTMAVFFVSAYDWHRGLVQLADSLDRQKRAVEERTAALSLANQQLEAAMKDIKIISGLLPICSHCKKIRDDEGYWQQVEHYVQRRSQAKFTHGVCPDCLKKLYPEIADKVFDPEK